MARLNPPRPLSDADPIDAFDCGRESINQWLRRHAKRNQHSNTSRTTVFTDATSGAIVGFVTLSAGQIARETLPKAAQRNTPAAVPIVLLGQLAVDIEFQGKGYARQILLHALRTCIALSQEIGCFGVLTHPLDDGLRQFYARFGFEELPGDPQRALIVRICDLVANGIGA